VSVEVGKKKQQIAPATPTLTPRRCPHFDREVGASAALTSTPTIVILECADAGDEYEHEPLPWLKPA